MEFAFTCLPEGSGCGKGREHKQCKYEITKAYCYQLPECFDGLEGSTVNRHPPYVALRDNRLSIRKGYRWNGANNFPDLRWTKESKPSP